MDAVGAAVVREDLSHGRQCLGLDGGQEAGKDCTANAGVGARAIDPASLRWHEGVVCLRALVEVFGWVAAGTIDGRDGHPWIINGPAFAARLRH